MKRPFLLAGALVACTPSSSSTGNSGPAGSSAPGTTTPPPSAAALSAAPPPSAAPPSSAAPSADCSKLFAAPSDGKQLCSEHVMGADHKEIHWQSYSVPGTPDAVFDRYRALAAKCGGTAKDTTIAKDNWRASVHDATAKGFPSCEKSKSATGTIVVISNMVGG